MLDATKDNIFRILDFWFGHVEETILPSERRIQIWFSDDPAIDTQIKENFSEDFSAIFSGQYDSWTKTGHGQLALIIVLDQFSRHLYRDQKKLYIADEKALQVCLDGFREEKDHELSLIERVFYYFPLLHSENLDYQTLSLENYALLVDMALPETRIVYDSFYRFSKHKWSVIDRFGRFPQRNKLLGRDSTEEEKLFLKAIESNMNNL